MGSLVQIPSPRPFFSPVPALLVTNDDGVHAPGLAALEAALAELGDVYVLAPEREQSACGHALTLHRPLRVDRLGERRFAVNGTPSDCVNLGVLGFLPERPVLVVAGVNHGTNLGDDVTYSGTVSAAMEGTLLGVPAIAVSLAPGGDLAVAAEVARLVALRVLVTGLPKMTLLNVNVPGAPPRGIRLTRLGHRVYREKIVEQTDPRGRTHYWIGAGEALVWRPYGDHPLPIGEEQTISQPYIVALMTELLELSGREKVLEIGTGSGYQTAVLAELARRVCSIERLPRLAERARALLEQRGYTNVWVRVGSGTLGWPDEAPFDRILVTASAPAVPPPLFAQLVEGGRMVVPIGDALNQVLTLVEKVRGEMKTRECGECKFVKLVGKYAWEA